LKWILFVQPLLKRVELVICVFICDVVTSQRYLSNSQPFNMKYCDKV